MTGLKFLVFSLFLIIGTSLFSQNNRIYKIPAEQYSRYIALVGDVDTCTETMEELNDYIAAIASKDYGVFLLCSQWKDAEILRLELAYLKDKHGIEGAIFFGNLPMTRISFTTGTSFVDSNYFYENFEVQYLKQGEIGDVEYFKLEDNSKKEPKRDIFVSRIFGRKEHIEDIRSFFKRITENYLNDRSSLVNKVSAMIGNESFNGSKYAALYDAEVWKQTISFFYPKSASLVNYFFLRDFRSSRDAQIKSDNDILLLLFDGNKKEYLQYSNSKLVISTELNSENYSEVSAYLFTSMIVFAKNVLSENIIPPNYHLVFTGQNIGTYYKNLPYLDARLFGDPIFSFEKSEKVTFDTNKDGIKLSRLFGTKKILSNFRENMPDSILSKLVVDPNEKIRFEVVKWAELYSPVKLFPYYEKMMLDPSDRVYKVFIDTIVKSHNRKGLSILVKNKDYFKKQGDELRLGMVDDGIMRFYSNIEKRR